MSNVKSLYGNPIGLREVNETALKEAQELLEAVQSGEVVGLAIVRLHYDDLSSYRIAGRCGGYGMIGALEHVKTAIMRINEE
jgi:hypothetical protein